MILNTFSHAISQLNTFSYDIPIQNFPLLIIKWVFFLVMNCMNCYAFFSWLLSDICITNMFSMFVTFPFLNSIIWEAANFNADDDKFNNLLFMFRTFTILSNKMFAYTKVINFFFWVFFQKFDNFSFYI